MLGMILGSLVSGTICCSVFYKHSSFLCCGKVKATDIDSQYLHCQNFLRSQKELRTPGPMSYNQTLCLSQDIKPVGGHVPWGLWCIQHEGTSISIILATVSLTITLPHTEKMWSLVASGISVVRHDRGLDPDPLGLLLAGDPYQCDIATVVHE